MTDERLEAVAKAAWDFERQGTDWGEWEDMESRLDQLGMKGRRYYRALAKFVLEELDIPAAVARGYHAGMEDAQRVAHAEMIQMERDFRDELQDAKIGVW